MSKKLTSEKTVLLILVVSLWLATSACSCGNMLRQAIGGRSSRVSGGVPEAAQTSPTPTQAVTSTLLVPSKEAAPREPIVIPSEPGVPFRLELDQQQINDYLADKTYSEVGVQASEIRLTLLEGRLLCEARVRHKESGIQAVLTIRGQPNVVDGQIYFLVEDVDLGNSLKGFSRLVVKGMIDEAIDQYSTAQGIPLPLGPFVWEEIQVTTGRLFVAGHRAD